MDTIIVMINMKNIFIMFNDFVENYKEVLKSSLFDLLAKISISITKHQKIDFGKWIYARTFQHSLLLLNFLIPVHCSIK